MPVDRAVDPDAVLARLRGVSAGRARTVVAVDGPSGSGKSTLADSVAAAVPGATVVRMDEIYPGWDGLAVSVALVTGSLLGTWSRGYGGVVPTWDWAADAPGEPRVVPDGPLLVLEGAGCGSRLAARYVDLLVWLDAPEPVRFARAMERDGEVFRPHWERWAAQERALFDAEGTAARADLVLDGG